MQGRLDTFFVEFTGTEVLEGTHIAEIYSPDLLVAQQDLIKATEGLARARKDGTAASIETQRRLLKAVRERLRLLGLTDEQIDAMATQAEPADHVTLFAPQDGVVTKRHVVEGAYVKEGTPLFDVASLESVWLNLEAYESDVHWLKFAQQVAFTVEAIPGKVFHGRVAYIDPEIDAMRRVVRVRVNVANDGRLLKPGMFARAIVDAQVAGDGSVIDAGLAGKWISPMHPEIVRDEAGKCPICGMDLVPAEKLGFIDASGTKVHGDPLLVPAGAVLQTGKRATVYVRLSASPDPKFEGREIVVGARVGEYFIVDSGLFEGELVVTRGAFKLDSELQIRAKPSMMNPNAGLVETPANQADESLSGQWGPVPRALGRLSEAVARGDVKTAHQVIGNMDSAIAQVNTESFQPKLLSDWREFSGRLRNTLVIAHKTDPSELDIAYRDIRVAMDEAGRFLGLRSKPVFSKSEISDERLAVLRSALDAYYPLAAALAADDESAALAARDEFIAAAEGLDLKADGLKGATDIAVLRAAFQPASDALIAEVRQHGADRVGSAYVVHCPMAFGKGKGANWISARNEILNPYRGAEMLSCGGIQENLSFEPMAMPEGSEPKAEHEHKHKHE